jgi:hypothetical protein
MSDTTQGKLDFGDSELEEQVEAIVRDQLRALDQPSAWDLLARIEEHVGWAGRWSAEAVLTRIAQDTSLTRGAREYVRSLLLSGDLEEALRGTGAPKREVESGIDSLLRQSAAYRDSKEFQDMVGFMGSFRDYAPFNNMLVRIQNPSCGFYATETDWARRFERRIKEDARPMLILAPMHPVMLVYDLDQTDGKELPAELSRFARFEGDSFNPDWLHRTVENAKVRDRIRIDFKTLSSTNAGFATLARGDADSKMRIAIHEKLDDRSRYGVICHELAHIYLGHLGTDKDYWWPSRTGLNKRTVEIEAEAVAFIATTRAGLTGSSAAYVSRYLPEGKIPPSVSLNLVAKVAGRIEEMGRRKLEPRRQRRNEGPEGNR